MNMAMHKYPINKWIIRIIAVIAFLAAGIYGVPRARYFLSHEYTDDAFVEGTIVPVSSEVRGKVSRVFVENNQRVRAGERLLEIEAEDYAGYLKEKQEALSEAEGEELKVRANMEVKTKELLQAGAEVAAMEASEKLSSKEKDRYASLRSKALVSQSQYDHVESRWAVDKARVDAVRLCFCSERGLFHWRPETTRPQRGRNGHGKSGNDGSYRIEATGKRRVPNRHAGGRPARL
jgi:multidrug resistance efflux pump